jgi:perosamine synthetase
MTGPLNGSRVLITGGAGLIGSHIADLLVSEDVKEIVVLDNFTRGRKQNLSSALESGRVTIVEGDVRDRRVVERALEGIDLVFHQAAIRITQCAEEPRLALEVLVNGTFNVVEAALKARVKKIVAASSASVYGLADEFPTSESQHPYHNRTLYGGAKAFNEALLRSFHDMHGLPYVALRYFNVYGPRMDVFGVYTEVLIRWMENIATSRPPKIFGDGRQTMDFVHVSDIARANILAAKADVSDEVFNVASGVETSLNDLAQTLLEVMNSSLSPEFGPERKVNPVPRRLADTAKARRLLGFEAKVTLAQGLRGLVEWWRNQCREAPAQLKMIPIAKPLTGEAELEAVRRPILSRWLTQGPEVAAFEREFAAVTGATYACAVSSCTAALHLALLATGVKPGDEVVTVSHSFIATANSVRYCGAIPVFADIDPGTFNMDPSAMERAICSRTRAILCVHQMGLPCDLRSILEIARRHGLPVIEDAACAIGSEILWEGQWEKIGKPHGDIACFSFHPRKLVTTGDGGLLTTRNPEYDRQFRLWRQHGMSLSDTERHSSRQVAVESYLELGYNYRLTDLQAAVGREQLAQLAGMVEKRRKLASRYLKLLEGVDGLMLPEEPSWTRANWQSFCVRLPEGCDQSEVMQSLLDRGVASRRGIMCAHREPAYAREPWSCGPDSLRESERAQDECILLPLFPELSEADQDRVVAALTAACAAPVVEAAR